MIHGEARPRGEVHLLEAGHFALDQKADEIARLVDRFMTSTVRS